MSTRPENPTESSIERGVPPGLVVRAGVGGVLMGLANLVPGISGGTMLLAAGVYRAFIGAVSDVTLGRLSVRAIVVLGTVVVGAGLAIALLAGPVVHAVVAARWAMYSLFIGLTLGGAPLLVEMIRRAPGSKRGATGGIVVGFLAMAALGVAQQMGVGAGAAGGASGSVGVGAMLLLLVAGIAGASAMVLPGVSGGYLLLVLGQYVVILASIDRLKDAMVGRDFGAALGEWRVIIPVGVGVVIGIAGVSNLLKWLLARFERATLGVLLGLLLGAVVGLWPFQRGVAPVEGDVVKGRVLSAEEASAVAPEDWRVETFSPDAMQIGGAIGLALLGFGVTMGVAHLGRERPKPARVPDGED